MKQSAFQFTSAFKYSELPSNDDLFDDNSNDNSLQTNEKRGRASQLVHKLIVTTFYMLFMLTFPISAFFCIKRINSLQRCVVFRLGIRLPLKGPGFIIKFPLIDYIEIVDLGDYQFPLVDRNQQLLTSDGSIIEFNSLTGYLNVINAVKSSIQLKDAKFNAEQFVKLSFINMIGSTHIEDIERKTDIVMKQFEENCNIYLNNWGYSCKFIDLPKFVVVSRANPINPIVSKLKGLFNTGESTEPNGFFSNMMKIQTHSSNKELISCDNELDDNDLLSSLQSMANKYSNYVFHDLYIAIHVEEINSFEYFEFNNKSGNVTKIDEKPNKVHIEVKAKTKQDLMQFCYNQDMNRVQITSSLL